MKTYKIFICHAWKYDDDYSRLKELLNSVENFSWKDFSIPFYKQIYAKTQKTLLKQIEQKMRFSNIVLVPLGMYVNYRKWMVKELNLALSYTIPKPIVGIIPRGSKKIPQDIQDYLKDTTFWNKRAIVKSIQKHASRKKKLNTHCRGGRYGRGLYIPI
jgi:hypothetical protein